MSSAWTDDELRRIGEADEVQITSYRRDGSLRPYVIIWAVRHDDAVYIRSAYGPDNGWFRRAKASGTGRIRTGGIERDVTFQVPEPDVHPLLDAAYHEKYDHHGARIVNTVVGPDVTETTFRLVPAPLEPR
jgi:hypothetical protein